MGGRGFTRRRGMRGEVGVGRGTATQIFEIHLIFDS